MEGRDDRNINEIKEYLKANGLDDSIAETPFFLEKFKVDIEEPGYRYGDRYFIYDENDGEYLHSRYRDKTGHIDPGCDYKIKKIGKTIILEEYTTLTGYEKGNGFEPYLQGTYGKISYYIDQKGKYLLAKKISRAARQSDDLCIFSSDGYCTIDEENLEKAINESIEECSAKIPEGKPYDEDLFGTNRTYNINRVVEHGYEIVEAIRAMQHLEKSRKENINLKDQNDRLQKMLQKALSFAQTVRDSRVGKIFFGKKAKEVLGEQDKNAKQLPEGTER